MTRVRITVRTLELQFEESSDDTNPMNWEEADEPSRVAPLPRPIGTLRKCETAALLTARKRGAK